MTCILKLWTKAIKRRDPSKITSLYSNDFVFLPTLSNEIKLNKQQGFSYFNNLTKEVRGVELLSCFEQNYENVTVLSGKYNFYKSGNLQTLLESDGSIINARYTFIIKDDKIVNHHSSVIP